MRSRDHRALLFSFLAALLTAGVAVSLAQNDDAKRDAWQRPNDVMDALGVRGGSRVADVGCGQGYFVMHLARRVGAEGAVYAVDVDEEALGKLRRRVEKDKLSNVQVIHSKENDPKLPGGELDGVLIVNAYHEMREHDAILRALHTALRPGGRLVIIDAPGKENRSRAEHRRNHTVSTELVREDAERNGFRFVREEPGFDSSREDSSRGRWFFLLFEKPVQ